MEFIETGVPNLDLVLGAGLVTGSLLMVTGAPGCGKTILTQQMAFHLARRGQKVLVLTTLSEPHTKLIGYLRTLAFFDERLIGDQIEFLNIYRQLREDFTSVGASIIRLVRERRVTMVIIDSFDSMHDLAPTDVAAKELIYELSAGLGLLGVTGVIVGTNVSGQQARLPELAIADSIIILNQELVDTRSVRSLEVRKMRGTAQRNGRHTYRIDASGVRLYPRQETVPLPPEQLGYDARVPFGLTELDAMMDGGPPVGTSTALTGHPSTGKTLLALQFLLAGQQRGEPGLLISFQETEQQLTAKAAEMGLDLAGALTTGLAFVYLLPAELDADEVAALIRGQIAQRGIRRLALDGLAELLRGVMGPNRDSSYFAALLAYLRNAGVTTCFTQELPLPSGAAPPLSPLAPYSADNIILLRQVEYHARLHRVLSIIKMRGSAHDRAAREFTIGPGGLTMLAATESTAGLLDALGS